MVALLANLNELRSARQIVHVILNEVKNLGRKSRFLAFAPMEVDNNHEQKTSTILSKTSAILSQSKDVN